MANTLDDFKRIVTRTFVNVEIHNSVTELINNILCLGDTHGDNLAAKILNVDDETIPYEMRMVTDWEAQCRHLIEDSDDDIDLGKICENCDIPFDDIVSSSDWELEDEDVICNNLRIEALPTIKHRLLSAIKEHNVPWKQVFGSFELYEDDCREVFEYWSVSSTARECLEKVGAFVVQTCGMKVWCRTTTGQAVYMDSCVQQAALEMYQMGYLRVNFENLKMLEVFEDIKNTVLADCPEVFQPNC